MSETPRRAPATSTTVGDVLERIDTALEESVHTRAVAMSLIPTEYQAKIREMRK